MREEYQIGRDLRDCKKQYTESKVLSIIGLFSTVIFSTLFYLFVLNGNIFDMILSGVVILFFFILSIVNLYSHKILTKTKHDLEREYLIATETPEEKLQRTRFEKLSRVVVEDEK